MRRDYADKDLDYAGKTAEDTEDTEKRHPRITRILSFLLTLIAAASTADAQGQVAVSGYGMLGSLRLDAAQTFQAVSDTSHAQTFGGGVQVTNLWKSFFVDVGFSSMTKDGQRVFIDDGVVQQLGIPLEVSMLYFDVAGGWRHVHRRLALYVGGGFSRLRYRETSESAQPGEDVADSGTGPLLVTGLDFTLSRMVRVGAELRYRRIGGILGSGGASANFDEDSAGGVSAGLRVSVGR